MLEHILKLYLPLIISNTLHMLVVKKSLFPGLRTPINSNLFGKNKTYRGFIVVTLLNAFFYSLINAQFSLKSALVGGLIGFAYVLFELPNSFIKRRLGIAPGQTNQKYRFLLLFMDKADSALGVTLAYGYLELISPATMAFLFCFAFLVHLSISYFLVQIKVKEAW